MKNYKELLHYYKDVPVSAVIEDLYLDLLHRTETINKLSRKIQKLKKTIRREQELKVFQYELKLQAYDELMKTQERIDKAMEITKKLLMNSADNRLIAKEEEMEYFDWLDKTLEKQLEILKGEKE